MVSMFLLISNHLNLSHSNSNSQKEAERSCAFDKINDAEFVKLSEIRVNWQQTSSSETAHPL